MYIRLVVAMCVTATFVGAFAFAIAEFFGFKCGSSGIAVVAGVDLFAINVGLLLYICIIFRW